MPDDWLLGMAYLLSLNKDRILDAQAIFMDLPQTELYMQTALYYYSLELHKKLYTDSEKLYLYSPLDLMKNMMVAAQKSEKCDIVKALQYWQHCLLGETQIDKNEHPTKDTSTLEQASACVDSEKITNKEQETGKDKIDVNIPLVISTTNDPKKTIISDDIDNVEWTDDWGDFSDDSTEATSDKKDKIGSKEILQAQTVSPFDCGIDECVTEEDRFNLFQTLLNRTNNLQQYETLKEIILEWPKFNMPNHITVDNHPVLKMMKTIILLITKTDITDSEKRILQEHEELVGLLTSKEVPQ